uniref:T9SS type A sorting domain-containing protein n=1 Tax=Flavobacterium sp. TaxID=239 RepID=UPI004048D69F
NTGSFEMAVSCVLSNGDFDANSFSAYPNPVKDVLNISYTSEISSVRVINMIGQEVLSRNINATSSQVDMSHLSAGTYIVNVTVGDAIKTLKVVKQ